MELFAGDDFAMLPHVLPRRGARGRDVGILAVAGVALQLIAPARGACIITFGEYAELFGLAAALTIGASLIAARLHSVP